MSTVSIQVQYSGPRSVTPPLQGYGLGVKVLSAAGMSPKIFVWQRTVTSSTDEQSAEYPDKFTHIASPTDLEQIPEDCAEPTVDSPYYRTDNITLLFRDMDELSETRALIDSDIAGLVLALREAQNLAVQEVKDY